MIGTLRIRRSAKRRIPIFYLEGSVILDQEWYPHQLARMAGTLMEARKWKITPDRSLLEHKQFGLVLLPEHAYLLAHEWSTWQRTYTPVSVVGKSVLDVGAGCGETAYFYFRKGARKVICVEPNMNAVECLKRNAVRHSWNVEIVPEPFKLEILDDYQFDFMKMDGEGCERELLRLDELPCTAIVESHSPELTEILTDQFKAKILATLSPKVSLLLIGNRNS